VTNGSYKFRENRSTGSKVKRDKQQGNDIGLLLHFKEGK